MDKQYMYNSKLYKLK